MSRHDVATQLGSAVSVYRKHDPEYAGRHRETDESWREPINYRLSMMRMYGTPLLAVYWQAIDPDVFTGECTV